MTSPQWTIPHTPDDARRAGREHRSEAPRRALATLPTEGRDPLGILDAQNSTRLSELIALRTERMAASPFTFYRGTAALMAADLGAGPSSDIRVASCGDAHVANFGFYASPQRTLVFDLNDFDEAAWAPWEWDLKRLVASIVIAGQSTARNVRVVRRAAHDAVAEYTRAMTNAVQRSPLERYYDHFEADGGRFGSARATGKVVRSAIAAAERRTGDRAARKLTEADGDGRLRFVERPPTMTHIEPELAARVSNAVSSYLKTVPVDIGLLFEQYVAADTVRRVVGVGSVGTRCYVTVFQEGAGRTLLLQTKEAGRSVLAEYGGCPQPEQLEELIAARGEGARVVALQRILQGVSDPFLGFMRGDYSFYVRQFRDMKGGIDAETLDDTAFGIYAKACAAVLARAHSQSPRAVEVVGYIGNGHTIANAIVDWSYAYADLSRQDYEAFIARG